MFETCLPANGSSDSNWQQQEKRSREGAQSAVRAEAETWYDENEAILQEKLPRPLFRVWMARHLAEDVPGWIEAPAIALTYRWKHFIGGHMGRLGRREDVTTHRRYMADIATSSRTWNARVVV